MFLSLISLNIKFHVLNVCKNILYVSTFYFKYFNNEEAKKNVLYFLGLFIYTQIFYVNRTIYS